MENNTQILKGILEGCVLSMISKEVTYGYKLLINLRDNGFDDMVGGTVYPLLLRLEKKNYITSKKRKKTNGLSRKYLYLTDEGRKELDDFNTYWDKLNVNVKKTLSA